MRETADGLASAAQGATGRVLLGLGAVDVMAAFVFGGVSVLTVYLATNDLSTPATRGRAT